MLIQMESVMFDTNCFRSFLKEKNQLCSYNIWIREPGGTEYKMIDEFTATADFSSDERTVPMSASDKRTVPTSDSSDKRTVPMSERPVQPAENSQQPPLTVPTFDKRLFEGDSDDDRSFLWLKYPGEYLMLVFFSRNVSLKDNDLDAAYHILYPCYSDHVIYSMESRMQMLAKRSEIQTRLADFSMQNMGMEKITQELQNLLGLPLVFVNLATGEQYPGSKKLPSALSFNALNALFASRKSPQYRDPQKAGQAVHYIHPIVSNNICLGCFIAAVKQELTQLDHMIFEQGATVAAMELVKNQSLAELYYRKAFQIFDELIHTNDPSALINKCNELSIDFNANYFCMVFAFASNIDLQVLEICVLRLISRIKKELAGIYQTVFFFQNRVTLLASLKSTESMPDIINRIEEIIAHTQKSENLMLSAGMGSLYEGAGYISKAYNEACKALSYQISRHEPGLIKFSEIGINRLFINLPREDADTFIKEVFEPLRSISKNQNGSLEDTLIAYMDTNCSISQTAEKLYIHINTLYQRLGKIEECLGISFNNTEDILRVRLACYLKRSYALS